MRLTFVAEYYGQCGDLISLGNPVNCPRCTKQVRSVPDDLTDEVALVWPPSQVIRGELDSKCSSAGPSKAPTAAVDKVTRLVDLQLVIDERCVGDCFDCEYCVLRAKLAQLRA